MDKPDVPIVGTGVTEVMFSGLKRSYTVVEVLSLTSLRLKRDKVTRSESGLNTYEPAAGEGACMISLRKNGKWYRRGDTAKLTNPDFKIGVREEVRSDGE